MNTIDHITECENKFTEKFGDAPNAVYMNRWLWEKIKQETRWFASVGVSSPKSTVHFGHHDTFIMDMRVGIDKTLAKNAIKVVREEFRHYEANACNDVSVKSGTVYEIMYSLPIETGRSKWRHITLD